MNSNIPSIIQQIKAGDVRTIARTITLVENELEGYDQLLKSLQLNSQMPLVGVTGPPGAGKSTLINALIKHITEQGKSVGIIAVDPTSPFNYGSLLGDRLRMAEHFNNPKVFIRSLATRGSLGGLSAKILEVVDVMRSAPFDYLFIETVGVGQSEVEIAGLADTTIVVMVPEAGDEVQTIKSGIMEIADIFVVNKSDRDGAATFVKNLQLLSHANHKHNWINPVIKAIATKHIGIDEIVKAIDQHHLVAQNDKRPFLLAEKAYRLIQNRRMAGVDKHQLLIDITKALQNKDFNLYQFVDGIKD